MKLTFLVFFVATFAFMIGTNAGKITIPIAETDTAKIGIGKIGKTTGIVFKTRLVKLNFCVL